VLLRRCSRVTTEFLSLMLLLISDDTQSCEQFGISFGVKTGGPVKILSNEFLNCSNSFSNSGSSSEFSVKL